ncbi:hypothetical protein RHGRI_021368 [Rhododendron griersonianum]|uniref:UBX domain-containing protein n=1 Tax=Rhododendron griersonianum TaxID=479676 RepID=A0AAV6JNE2_9ERIC|nr:hypothetical protein RHGRI_021368 [Rhododendron griersonianum]
MASTGMAFSCLLIHILTWSSHYKGKVGGSSNVDRDIYSYMDLLQDVNESILTNMPSNISIAITVVYEFPGARYRYEFGSDKTLMLEFPGTRYRMVVTRSQTRDQPGNREIPEATALVKDIPLEERKCILEAMNMLLRHVKPNHEVAWLNKKVNLRCKYSASPSGYKVTRPRSKPRNQHTLSISSVEQPTSFGPPESPPSYTANSQPLDSFSPSIHPPLPDDERKLVDDISKLKFLENTSKSFLYSCSLREAIGENVMLSIFIDKLPLLGSAMKKESMEKLYEDRMVGLFEDRIVGKWFIPLSSVPSFNIVLRQLIEGERLGSWEIKGQYEDELYLLPRGQVPFEVTKLYCIREKLIDTEKKLDTVKSRHRGGAIADEASKVISVIEVLVWGGLLIVVNDGTQATTEEDGDNNARQDRILALKTNLLGNPCVLSAEYLESVAAALVMRLRQHEETVSRDGTGLAGMRQKDLIEWYVSQLKEENYNTSTEEAAAEVSKVRGVIEEPTSDDENQITIEVRMPNGSCNDRRFLKSDKLQSIFDFIDVWVKPGSYRLVRPYTQCAFSDGETALTLNELGFTSKEEVIFLELI